MRYWQHLVRWSLTKILVSRSLNKPASTSLLSEPFCFFISWDKKTVKLHYLANLSLNQFLVLLTVLFCYFPGPFFSRILQKRNKNPFP